MTAIPSRPEYEKTPTSTEKTAEAFADALVSLLGLLQLDAVIVVGICVAGRTAFASKQTDPTKRCNWVTCSGLAPTTTKCEQKYKCSCNPERDASLTNLLVPDYTLL